jgi:hypothetical protein
VRCNDARTGNTRRSGGATRSTPPARRVRCSAVRVCVRIADHDGHLGPAHPHTLRERPRLGERLRLAGRAFTVAAIEHEAGRRPIVLVTPAPDLRDLARDLILGRF